MTLKGKRILLGRHPGESSAIEQLLLQNGAQVSSVALIEVRSLSPAEIKKAVATADIPDFAVITSKNAINGYTLLRQKLPRHRLAVVGNRTAAACRQNGFEPDICGNGKGAISLLHLMAAHYHLEGAHILYPCSNLVIDEFARAARALGATVNMVPVYRTEAPPNLAAEDIANHDAAVYFSSSGAENFNAVLPFSSVTQMGAVAMGEQTASTLRNLGARNIVVAETPDANALFEAVLKSFKEE